MKYFTVNGKIRIIWSGVVFTEDTYQWFTEDGQSGGPWQAITKGNTGRLIYSPTSETSFTWQVSNNTLTITMSGSEERVYQKVNKFSWE